jgi:hypothetical protein
MFKQSVGVAFLLVSLLGCGDGGAGAGSASASAKPAASGSAKPAASASAKPSAAPAPASASAAAPAGDITMDEYVKTSSAVLKAVADNAADCKKMAEAIKAVLPDDAKIKALDEWEAKQKADPELKKALDAAMEKAMEPLGKEFVAGVAKCEKDPDVKALMDKMKNDDKKDDDKKDDDKKEEPKK